MSRNAGHLLENYFNKFFMGKGKKKKIINVLTVFSISRKNAIKTFLK